MGLPRAASGIAAATASGKFFERRLGFGVGLRVLRAHGQTPKAQCCQLLADCPFMQLHAKLRRDPLLQIAPTPAHYAVFLCVGTGIDPIRKRCQLLGRQPPGVFKHPPVLASSPARPSALVRCPFVGETVPRTVS